MSKRLLFPTSLPEFSRRFSTENSCWEYLRDSRWSDGFVCPRDGTSARSFIKTRGLWVCQKGHQVSVTTDTTLHGTRIPLCTWFWSAYLMATQTPGISALQLARQLDLNYETAYMILQRLRVGTVSPGRSQLRGTLEVDETIIGGKQKGLRGRGMGPKKSLVICAVEIHGRSTGRIRMKKIRSGGEKDIMGFIQKNIEKRSRIKTDGWRTYKVLPKYGYKHTPIIGETSVASAEELPHIHRIFSNLKTWINGTYHGVSGKHLQAYLNEFTFRFNRRKTPMAAFQTLLGINTHVEGPSYEEFYDTGFEDGWFHPNPLDMVVK